MSSLYVFAIIFLSSFLITFVSVKIVLIVSLKQRIGQKILEDGPTWHKEKEGTPTMGGIAFPIAIFSAFFVFVVFLGGSEDASITPVFCVILFALFNSLIGFLDDYLKIKNSRNKGLTAPAKFALQSIAAVAFLVLIQKAVGLSTVLKIPFVNFTLDIGILYYLFAYLLLCGFVNAVNLTDGLDGLAASSTLPVAILLSFVGLFVFEELSYTYLGGALFGLLVAFLLFNRHPAKIFMGDTGSLFLGGIIAGISLSLNNALLVILFGFVYLCEALSVIIQVAYFKISNGKRIFKMAPLHHHLEKCGWSERKIVTVFTLVNSFTCILALIGMII